MAAISTLILCGSHLLKLRGTSWAWSCSGC